VQPQRNRHQNGSLQVRSHGRRKMWVLLYRENGARRYTTLGPASAMSKSQAQAKRDELLRGAQAKQAQDSPLTFARFVETTALPFLHRKWKRSTALTTENRIRCHLVAELGHHTMQELNLNRLQQYLHDKTQGLSKSTVAHLRWDLRLLFRLAIAEGQIERDPTAALYTPEGRTATRRVMNEVEVQRFIACLELRERTIARLAIFAGMRPGEILALKRRHLAPDCSSLTIEQRLYRGDIDSPKTSASARTVAIPTRTAETLKEWMECVDESPEAWLFASENPETPLWRENLWQRHMLPHLRKEGLEWASFQVMRRTHASLGHDAGIDPKIAADQRGHGIGVALQVYTRASLSSRAKAAEQLEQALAGKSA
jgi:integrase